MLYFYHIAVYPYLKPFSKLSVSFNNIFNMQIYVLNSVFMNIAENISKKLSYILTGLVVLWLAGLNIKYFSVGR